MKAVRFLRGMSFYLDVSLYKMSLALFLIASSHVSRSIIVLWSIQRYLLVETLFKVETGQLLSIADQWTGFFMVRVIVQKFWLRIYENHLLIIYVSNTLQFFHITPNMLIEIL